MFKRRWFQQWMATPAKTGGGPIVLITNGVSVIDPQSSVGPISANFQPGDVPVFSVGITDGNGTAGLTVENSAFDDPDPQPMIRWFTQTSDGGVNPTYFLRIRNLWSSQITVAWAYLLIKGTPP